MAVWVVRAGKYGEQEEFALAWDYAVIDWPELGDLARFQNREDLKRAMAAAYPDREEAWPQFVGQTWAFAREIRPGDLVVLPLKKRDGRQVGRMREDGIIAIGEIIGDYSFVADGPPGTEHRRKARWIKRDIPRIELCNDLSASLENTQLTVFQPGPARAEGRFREMAEKA